jgi:PPM family protein phosphatase
VSTPPEARIPTPPPVARRLELSLANPTTKLSQSAGSVRCTAVSDVGMRRASNQDSLAIALADDDREWRRRGHLFVVADGMGAHAAGELASQLATDNIPHVYLKRQDMSPCESIVAAVQDANGRIFAKGQHSVDFHGMGTTCSCLLLLPDGALAAHVGDSRVYRLRGHSIEQLTFDHSLVWEMASASHAPEEEVPAYVPKNVITRSLGPHPTVKVDLEGPWPIKAADRYLLCSDGLTGPLNPSLIGMILASLSPEDAAQTLVDLANLLGGPDNITVLVVEVAPKAKLGKAATEWGDAAANASPQDVAADDSYFIGAAGAGAVVAAGLAAVGQFLFAVVAGAIAAVALGAWWLRRTAFKRNFKTRPVRGSYGKAPYRHYRVEPTAENVEMLSDIVRQLEDLETQRKWPFDWKLIHEDRSRAHHAIATGDYAAAVIAYSSAVRRLMQAVRDTRPTTDSGINLGRD